MLHLVCFCALGTGGVVGEQNALGNRYRSAVRNRGQGRGGRNSILFYSDLISIHVGKGSGVRSRRVLGRGATSERISRAGCLSARITWFIS